MKTSAAWIAVAGVALSAVAAVVILDPFTAAPAERALRPGDPALLAAGEQIYFTHCASCHGARLEGQPDWRSRNADGLLPAPPHDASGHTWHHPDQTLFRITKHGVARIVADPTYKTAMPVYEGVLSDDEIVAVLSWIKAQWPADLRAKHDLINAQAARVARP